MQCLFAVRIYVSSNASVPDSGLILQLIDNLDNQLVCMHLLQELYTDNTLSIQSYIITPVLLPVASGDLLQSFPSCPGLASLYAHPRRISGVLMNGMTTINFYIQFSVKCHGIEHALQESRLCMILLL